jgi:hypothetical protein
MNNIKIVSKHMLIVVYLLQMEYRQDRQHV